MFLSPPKKEEKNNNCFFFRKSLQSPFYFMVVNIIQVESNVILSSQEYLSGSTVSSLYRLRDIDNTGTIKSLFLKLIFGDDVILKY